MREIKFRAWDKHVKKMGKVTEIIFSNVRETLVKYQYIDDYGKTIDEQSHIDDKGHGVVKLLQYTGLKDKRGNEIYEGDVLTDDFENGPMYVDFHDGIFVFVDKFDKFGTTMYTALDIHYEGLEIIGNIYEHPHMIGGEINE